jgi:hypothetical protein
VSTHNSHILRLNDKISLSLSEITEDGLGDSSPLQKGLLLLIGNRSVCGEGMGFGAPALDYPEGVFFSTYAKVQERSGELVKSYSINAFQRKTWRDKFPVDNGLYLAVERRLVEKYRKHERYRKFLSYLIRLTSILGFKLSYQGVQSKGSVDINYRLSGNRLMVRVDTASLADRQHRNLLIFTEQSAAFDLYRDEFSKIRGDGMGAWKEISSAKACLTNQDDDVTFCVRSIPETRLFGGRELLRPRLDWAGFCYLVPPGVKQFEYEVEII